jgi:hypothetical protein
MALQSMNQSAIAGVYQSLSALPDPDLKALGIFGRIEAGDASAVFELEKNLPTVVSAYTTLRCFPLLLVRLDLKMDLPAAHALARTALSDTTVASLEGQLAFALARTRSPEMLPYLMVMLGSPEPGIRDSALMSFRFLLGPMPDPSALWKPEMAGYCPMGSPVNDREIEQKDVQFWAQWWESHREEIAKTVALPTAGAPARYRAERREEARSRSKYDSSFCCTCPQTSGPSTITPPMARLSKVRRRSPTARTIPSAANWKQRIAKSSIR